MLLVIVAAALAAAPPAPDRTERLVALAQLDAVVHYFVPDVATRASAWDSIFAANVVRIADARDSREYERLVSSLVRALPTGAPAAGSGGRALVYEGFPTSLMRTSGGYRLRWRSANAAEVHRVDMGEGVHVDVPLAQAAIDTAQAIAPLPMPASAEWRAAYPAAGYRILAAARIWSTIRLFFPYKPLIGESWDAQFRAALPAFEQARDSLEYAQAVAGFAARTRDTHVMVGSRALSDWIGTVQIGAGVRFIEDQLVVTRLVHASASGAGLRVGDVVLSVDGESIAQRGARLEPFLAVSTPQSLRDRLAGLMLAGRDTTPARLVVRGEDGRERTLAVPRSRRFSSLLREQRAGSIIRILPGNVGYVDLDRLTLAMVDSAFRMLAGTRAIVLDDRGYPRGTAWAIAPRLGVPFEGRVAARFRRLIVPSPDTARTTVYSFEQAIPPARGALRYTGPTVLLVDERTISQAEHTGLFFKSANGTTIIGSPSMGANGDVTGFAVPGGISISFSGHDVRHADGSQLQRVGLLPDVRVEPTVAGIRAGRDEVLEAAVRHVGGTGVIPPDTAVVALAAPTPLGPLPDEPAVTGWQVAGSAPVGFRFGIDVTVARGGSSSGHITARTTEPEGFATLMQALSAERFRGKRVRFSAFVRSRDVTGGAALWLRVDGNGGTLAFDNMRGREITGTTGWTHASVVLDVPTEADGLSLGFLLRGGGEAWIDDASLEIVGRDVPVTGAASAGGNPSRAEAMRRQYQSAPATLANPGFERH